MKTSFAPAKRPRRLPITVDAEVRGGEPCFTGTRLNTLFKEVIKDAEIEAELRPLFARFATERTASERFGDWCDRVLLKEQSPAAN